MRAETCVLRKLVCLFSAEPGLDLRLQMAMGALVFWLLFFLVGYTPFMTSFDCFSSKAVFVSSSDGFGNAKIQEHSQRLLDHIDKLISTAACAVTDDFNSTRPTQCLPLAWVVLVVGPCTLCPDNGTAGRQSADGTVSLNQVLRREVVTILLLETSVSL